jgi:hypothetical protein
MQLGLLGTVLPELRAILVTSLPMAVVVAAVAVEQLIILDFRADLVAAQAAAEQYLVFLLADSQIHYNHIQARKIYGQAVEVLVVQSQVPNQ